MRFWSVRLVLEKWSLYILRKASPKRHPKYLMHIISSISFSSGTHDTRITKLYITKLILGITNYFFTPVIVKYMKKNLNITKPRYSKNFCQSQLTNCTLLNAPRPFVISSFLCSGFNQCLKAYRSKMALIWSRTTSSKSSNYFFFAPFIKWQNFIVITL